MTKDERIKELEEVAMELFDMVHEGNLIELKCRANDLYDTVKGQTLPIDSVIVTLVCECPPLESQFMVDGLETDWCLTCGGKAN